MPDVQNVCVFKRFDLLDVKIFFEPRAARDGRRAAREALRARLEQWLDNACRLGFAEPLLANGRARQNSVDVQNKVKRR